MERINLVLCIYQKLVLIVLLKYRFRQLNCTIFSMKYVEKLIFIGFQQSSYQFINTANNVPSRTVGFNVIRVSRQASLLEPVSTLSNMWSAAKYFLISASVLLLTLVGIYYYQTGGTEGLSPKGIQEFYSEKAKGTTSRSIDMKLQRLRSGDKLFIFIL